MKHLVIFFIFTSSLLATEFHHPVSPMFNMKEIYDSSTLDVQVIEDWHLVNGPTPTRQKLINIRVGEFWPGQGYRVPLRLIVPAKTKAKGFHLTGGNNLKKLNQDLRVRGLDEELIQQGVGLAMTIVQEFGTWGQKELGDESKKRFAKTLNPKYSIQYWAWPASLMRCVTAAYAEDNYFEKGKVLLSGGSKNGASPSVSIIHDPRITGLHATVSPICESPLRLCDDEAWNDLKEYYSKKSGDSRHRFLGGTFGPIYNQTVIEQGNTWADLKKTANLVSPHIFISQNWKQLMERGCQLYFHPGTHDFVAFDMPSLGKNYPQIPTYNRINSGHGKRPNGAKVEKHDATKQAFILQHFASAKNQMLRPPKITYEVLATSIKVTVTFEQNQKAESGRLYWMYDRAPEGTIQYIKEDFPAENYKEMKMGSDGKSFVSEIPLQSESQFIDFYSNHRKTISVNGKMLPTHISSPYIRVTLKN